MLVKAQVRYIRISPTKVRQILNLIKGKDVLEAEALLLNLNKRPKECLLKLLKSAIANAKQKGYRPEQLYIQNVICNKGPMWKRYKAQAFGRANPILRRTSHIRIELELKNI
jgi:large subunit ribosomal protein L22